MIYLLYGDNEFEKRQRVVALLDGAAVWRYNGEELEMGRLRQLLQGQTLFDGDKPVMINHLSDNPDAWVLLPKLAKQTDTLLVLLETKPDKRTKTYKWLQKHAEVTECVSFGERDRAKLVAWCMVRADEAHGLRLPHELAQRIVERLGHDQLRIDQCLGQLALADEVTTEVIDALLPLAKAESAFALFDAALRGDGPTVRRIIAYLEADNGDDGAYQTLGLLASQATTLAGLVLGGESAAIARDMGTHPFVVKRLKPLAQGMSRRRLCLVVELLARADQDMKSTAVRPWLLLEAALVRIVQSSAI